MPFSLPCKSSLSDPVLIIVPIRAPTLSGHSCTQNLGSKESALGPLDHLLVYAAWRVVHYDSALLVVNLGIHSCVTDQIDDPLLSLILAETQSRAQVLNIDTCVNLAVALRDQVTGCIDEKLSSRDQEEVRLENLLSERKLSLGFLKVEVDVKSTDKVSDRVGVLVDLLLHDTNDILQLLLVLARVSRAATASDDGSSQVSQDPRAAGLYTVDEGWAEEEIEDLIPSAVVVEEREKSPVNQPGTVVELGKRIVEKLAVNSLLDLLQLLDSFLPVGGKDFRSQLSPSCRGHLVVICREHTELIKKL
jgi:hypothetical protein